MRGREADGSAPLRFCCALAGWRRQVLPHSLPEGAGTTPAVLKATVESSDEQHLRELPERIERPRAMLS